MGPLAGCVLGATMDRVWVSVLRALFGAGLLCRFYDVDAVARDDALPSARSGGAIRAVYDLCMQYAAVCDERVHAKLVRGMGFLLGAAPRLATEAASRKLLSTALAAPAEGVRIAALAAVHELLSGEEVAAAGGAAAAHDDAATAEMNGTLLVRARARDGSCSGGAAGSCSRPRAAVARWAIVTLALLLCVRSDVSKRRWRS